MSNTTLRRGLALAALVPLLAGLSACGDDDDPAKDGVDAGSRHAAGAAGDSIETLADR